MDVPCQSGKVGCPFVQDSVASARELGQPTVVPPEAPTRFCEQETVQIEAGKHMKYSQEEYWGSSAWETSWNSSCTSETEASLRFLLLA